MNIKKHISMVLASAISLCLFSGYNVKAETVNNESDKNAFVQTDGTNFTLNGKKFYFEGTNNYYLSYGTKTMVDTAFEDAKDMGLTVMRTWGFDDGHTDTGYPLQKELGEYNEEAFKKFDYLIEKARECNIKLIIPLVNNWQDFGGMDQYVSWTGAGSHDDFFTNEKCKEAFKNYINYFLNRVNSYSGIKYKDDPTIMCIELANEPRCQSDQTGNTLYNWAKEMSEYIKSIDKNHLVALGDEGFFNDKKSSDYNYNGGAGVDFDRILSLKSIDFGTYHLYPDGWQRSVDWGTQWIIDHINSGKAANKPVVLEEFGVKSDKDNVYKKWAKTVIDNDGAGLMFWLLTSVGYDGTSLYPDYDGFRIVKNTSTAEVLKDAAEKMKAKNVSIEPIYGDVNNDSKVTMLDYTLLKEYINGKKVSINEKTADINKDGEISIKDLFLLRQLMLSE